MPICLELLIVFLLGGLLGYSLPFMKLYIDLKNDPELRQKAYDDMADLFIKENDWGSLRELNWSEVYRGCKKRMTDMTGSIDDES